MRAHSIRSIYEKKHKTYDFDGIWKRAFGDPETNGAWLVWGQEKNGKTWFALMLADYLSKWSKVYYISGEEGRAKGFIDAMQRAGLEPTNYKVRVLDYTPIDELEQKLQNRKAPKVIIIDNLTIYNDELKYGKFRDLIARHHDKLFVFLAHEENKQPYTGTAKMCRKLAKIIVHVQGLAAHVSGRCPGGVLTIHEEKAQLYWGTEISK